MVGSISAYGVSPRATRTRERGRRRADLAIGSTAWGADSTGTLTGGDGLLRLRVQDRGDLRARAGGELLRLTGVAEDAAEHVLEDVRALDVRPVGRHGDEPARLRRLRERGERRLRRIDMSE